MTPVLWSFRRCPYAMRARLAIASAGLNVELREIVLRAKPEAFLETSPSGTVPCLRLKDEVIDESLDIMRWALGQNDPEGWLHSDDTTLIAECDGPFKTALDHYKYPTRYESVDAVAARNEASDYLRSLNNRLAQQAWLCGPDPGLSDMAILPFVRQCAHVDQAWFYAQDWTALIRWLGGFKTSDRFAGIMQKYPAWKEGDAPVSFP